MNVFQRFRSATARVIAGKSNDMSLSAGTVNGRGLSIEVKGPPLPILPAEWVKFLRAVADAIESHTTGEGK